MLVEASLVETNYRGHSGMVEVKIKVYLTSEQAHRFTEYPLLYVKNAERDNDFVCPECGSSLS